MERPGAKWGHFPLLRLILPFMGGIICLIHGFLPLWVPALAGIAGIMALTMAFFFPPPYGFRWLFGAHAVLFVFSAGYFLARYHVQSTRAAADDEALSHQGVWLAQTLEYPEEKENSYKVLVRVLGSDSLPIAPRKALLYLEKDSMLASRLAYGSRLMLYTRWQRPSGPVNPDQFDYAKYLERNGITHQAYVRAEHIRIQPQQRRRDFRGAVMDTREHLLKQLLAYGFSRYEYTLAAAILLGRDDTMDPRLRSGFAAAGAMHILCVSGLHVGVIFLILDQLLKFLNRRKYGPQIKALVLLIMIWLYAMLTGMAPSVMRASTMISFVIVGKALNRPTSVYNSLAASAFLLLITNPLIITHIGFQLSYLAVFSIVTFQPIIYNRWKPKNKILQKAWAITTVSLAAQLGTFPLAVHYFHIFPVYFLITNLIVIPLSSLIIYSGFLFFAFLFFHPLAWLFAWLLYSFLWVLKTTVFAIYSLPGASLEFISFSALQVLMVYVVIMLVYRWFTGYSHRALIASLVISCLLMYSFLPRYMENHQRYELVFYHAGRGLALEVIAGKENVVLMDSTTAADPMFVEYNMTDHWVNKGLKKARIKRIEEDTIIQKPFMQYHNNMLAWNHTLVYILRHDSIKLTTPPDLLVVHHHRAIPNNVLDSITPKKIILTGKVPPWNREKWKKLAEETHTPVHLLSQKALVIGDGHECTNDRGWPRMHE